jgi:hypothetical protein
MKHTTGFAEVEQFNRVNLRTVTGDFPPLICDSTAYLGWPSLISGPTGSAKTLICRWLLLRALRAGYAVGHADQEMGASVTKQYYLATGASEFELDEIAYWDMPSPNSDQAEAFTDAIRAAADVIVMDKVPDFLRTAGKQENSNDDVNEWMAAFVEPLRGSVTTLLIDATGWDGKHARGGSEKDFKVGLSWLVEVVEEPTKDRLGLIRWTCTKDRFGQIGKGASIEFSIGGDGSGHIVGSIVGVTDAPVSPADIKRAKEREREQELRIAALHAAKKHAPDETRAITRTQLADNTPIRAQDKSKAIDLALEQGDPVFGRLASKPATGRGTLVWWTPYVTHSDEGSQGSQPVPEPSELVETNRENPLGNLSGSQGSQVPAPIGNGTWEPSAERETTPSHSTTRGEA